MRRSLTRIAFIRFVALAVTPLALFGASANSLYADQAAPPPPSIPDPVAVTVDPRTTALLVLDITQSGCPSRPECPPTIPAIRNLLNAARAASAPVIYSTGRTPSPIMPEIAPLPGDPSVAADADKFVNTSLADILTGYGVDTLVIVGSASNGATLYTTFHANELGYTVVVSIDGNSADNSFQDWMTQYQLLNDPGYRNPNNVPLMKDAATMSRSDLITWLPGK